MHGALYVLVVIWRHLYTYSVSVKGEKCSKQLYRKCAYSGVLSLSLSSLVCPRERGNYSTYPIHVPLVFLSHYLYLYRRGKCMKGSNLLWWTFENKILHRRLGPRMYRNLRFFTGQDKDFFAKMRACCGYISIPSCHFILPSFSLPFSFLPLVTFCTPQDHLFSVPIRFHPYFLCPRTPSCFSISISFFFL